MKQAKEHLTFDDKSQLPFLSYISHILYPLSTTLPRPLTPSSLLSLPNLSLPHSCTPLELVPILYFAYDTTFPGPPLLGTSPSHSYLKMSDKLFIYLQRIPPRAYRIPPSIASFIHNILAFRLAPRVAVAAKRGRPTG